MTLRKFVWTMVAFYATLTLGIAGAHHDLQAATHLLPFWQTLMGGMVLVYAALSWIESRNDRRYLNR